MTIFLAIVLGWYFIIFGLAAIFRHEQLQAAMLALTENLGVFFLLAIFTLILGLLMVVSHNIWLLGMPLLVTILSWVILVSGIVRLFFLEYTRQNARAFIQNSRHLQIMGIVVLVLGVVILGMIYFMP